MIHNFEENIFASRSSLFKELQEERQQILSLKWLKSESAGHDIGYDRAILDWAYHHRDDWRSHYRQHASPQTS